MEDRQLGDLINVQSGYAFKSKDYTDKGHFLIRIGNVQDGCLALDKPKYVTLDDRTIRFSLHEGDLLTSLTGNIGRVARVDKSHLPAALNQRVARLTIKDVNVISEEYLYYFLKSDVFKNELSTIGHGAAQQNVSPNSIKALTIPLASRSEQKRIVTILDEAFAGIDTAIASTEKNLANSRELFESYLDSVAHDKQSMGGFVTIKTGKLNANAAVDGGKYPFFTCSREIYEIDSYAFDCEAILLAGNNASGDFNVKHYEGKFNAYQRTYVITIDDEKRLSYRFLYFQLLKSLKELKRSSVGAGTKFLKLGMIQDLKISVPTLEKQTEILEKLESLMENSKRLESVYQTKLNSLKELKQSLLQKAFSGELTAEADKLMDEAVA